MNIDHLREFAYLAETLSFAATARPFLPSFVRYMEKTHPEIELDLQCLEYGELIRAHRTHNVDVIFNMDFDPEAVDTCDSERIYSDRLYVVVGKKHPLAVREAVSVEDLAGERILLPDEQAYPGLAQRYESLTRGVCDSSKARRYKDIDTLYFRIAQNDCVGFSSGHNYRQLDGRVVFLPLRDVDTGYTVSAQWLKSADARIAQVVREAACACAERLQGWSDGVND